jgi:hypothetical protein
LINPSTLSGSAISVTQSSGTYIVRSSSISSVTIVGDTNTIKIDDGVNAGVMQISGNTNTILFAPTATVTSINITGSTNTVYLPLGSNISIANAGSMVITNTVRYYKP